MNNFINYITGQNKFIPTIRTINHSQYLAPLPLRTQKIAPLHSSQAYTNLDSSSGRLTNNHSRTLHIVYPNISRAIHGDPVMQKNYNAKGATYIGSNTLDYLD